MSCVSPLVAADFSSMPLSNQSVASLRQTAVLSVQKGNWKAWTAWLEKNLSAELGSRGFRADATSINRLLGQPQFALALSQWRLLSVTGIDHFQAVADKDGSKFLTWLFGNQDALDAYLGSGPLDKEETARGLEIWRELYAIFPESRSGLWLRVAAATALAHTVPVKSLADGGDIDPLQQFRYFRNTHASGLLSPSFDTSATWELRFVVNTWARPEELSWVLGAMDPKIKSQEKIGDACGMVPYRSENSKGVSIHSGAAYYDNLPATLERMHTIGGVCGAISKFGTAATQAFGVPAMPVGQPGHCAFLWKKDPKTWRTGNDIFGWAGSSQHGGIYIHWGNRGSYVLLMEAAHRDPANFLASERALWAAPLAGPNALALIQSATKTQPLNAGAWQVLEKKLADDKATPLESWQSVARDLMQAMPDHPLPLIDLLAPVEEHLELSDLGKRRQYLGAVSAVIAKGDATAQNGCGQEALSEIVQREAAAQLPDGMKGLNAMLANDAPGTPEQRAAVLALVETAMKAASSRADLENALTGRYLGLMTSDPVSLARAIKFFGGLFETAKTNGDRKPALALGRKIILLAAQAEDLSAMEKYSGECRKLLD